MAHLGDAEHDRAVPLQNGNARSRSCTRPGLNRVRGNLGGGTIGRKGRLACVLVPTRTLPRERSGEKRSNRGRAHGWHQRGLAQNARIGDIEIADTIADTGGNSPKLELAVDTVPPAGAEPILLVLRLSFADPHFVRF